MWSSNVVIIIEMPCSISLNLRSISCNKTLQSILHFVTADRYFVQLLRAAKQHGDDHWNSDIFLPRALFYHKLKGSRAKILNFKLSPFVKRIEISGLPGDLINIGLTTSYSSSNLFNIYSTEFRQILTSRMNFFTFLFGTPSTFCLFRTWSFTMRLPFTYFITFLTFEMMCAVTASATRFIVWAKHGMCFTFPIPSVLCIAWAILAPLCVTTGTFFLIWCSTLSSCHTDFYLYGVPVAPSLLNWLL